MKYLMSMFFSVLFSSMALSDDLDVKIEKILYPCVRVLNGSGGGSGTVIYSEDREKTGTFQTFVMTNHHVIRNLIRVEKKWDNLTQSYSFVENNELADVEIFEYANGGRTVTKFSVKATIIAYVEDEDIAILKLNHPFQHKYAIEMLPKDKPLRLFQQIYAVGCPLLVDPIFTSGEVSDLDFIIDKKSYTGGSANIIWGNSGGAVVTNVEGKWYFCGIPSRGQGAQNGQFVTYMGYYITPERIREFVATQKLDFILDKAKTPTECFEARRKLQDKNKGDSGPESATESNKACPEEH